MYCLGGYDSRRMVGVLCVNPSMVVCPGALLCGVCCVCMFVRIVPVCVFLMRACYFCGWDHGSIAVFGNSRLRFRMVYCHSVCLFKRRLLFMPHMLSRVCVVVDGCGCGRNGIGLRFAFRLVAPLMWVCV